MARAFLIGAAALLLLTARSASGGVRAAVNPIVAENARAGTTSWQRPTASTVELYGSEITAAPGDVLHLHVSTSYRYRLVVYRLGWYGGSGGRELACVPGCNADEQGRLQGPPTGSEPIRADWPVTDSVQTGSDWTSGYYLVEAVQTSGPDAGKAAWTWVILRAPAKAAPSQILVQVPVNTWEAYNEWGGKSLYDFVPPRAHAVSFDRPWGTRAQSPLSSEIQLVRFLEREGYDLSYQTDLDTDRDPASLLRHRLVIVAGHDEYWTMAMRNAFDTARARGTNLFFAGSNDAYWHIEYRDGGRTIYGWKSLYDPNPIVSQKTAMFREIGRSESCLMGVQHSWFAILDHPLDYTVTSAGAADPWLAGTGLHAGDTIAGVVGREHDKLSPYPAACFHPGLTVLFHYDGKGVDQDGDAVKFIAPGGARVFASGAQAFSWALDDFRSDGSGSLVPISVAASGVPVDPRVQRFVHNALDDLTRPAAPVRLRVHVHGRSVHVQVARTRDPRVTGFLAAVAVGRHGWRALCHGTTSCSGTTSSARGAVEVGVVALDRWRRSSAAAYAVAHR